ncbi:hypothetical protein [Rhizobium leguminosarum]|uniref:hypothetical protein n=1 Tax=Rhizobium leguminosarum TaxID=384 RepID=UPI00102FB33D|nr:hypothetical protein [Rhizobium leguminosarum]TAX90252.1 hypothetical protein ELH95_27510 [Rhizobium leguminosarum]
MAVDSEAKSVRSLLAKSAFGTSAKNYLAAISRVGAVVDDPARLTNIAEILEADESAYSRVNIFRLSMIFRIRHILLDQPPPPIFTEKSRFLEKKGGALFDESIAGTLSSAVLPYQILLPFGLAYGTSREYFSEIDFNSNLTSADANLYRFFSKIGDDNFNRRTHAWIPQITRATREIYDNILNHAYHASHAPKYQYTEQHRRERARFWFFGFRRFVYSDQSAYFSTLRFFQDYRVSSASAAKYYIVVNITDDGPGIVRYYSICADENEKRVDLGRIIQQKLSSTTISGAGHGISNAASEIIQSRGYLQVEANSEIYSTYYDGSQDKIVNSGASSEVTRAGTTVDLVIPVF